MDHTKPPTESLMCFGCDNDDGWYDIISSMCSLIDKHLEGLETNKEKPYRFTQIKEKFGGLRVYNNWSDDYISGVIDMAESMSYKTCELTGMPGKLCSNGSWIKTLSPEKMDDLGYKRQET